MLSRKRIVIQPATVYSDINIQTLEKRVTGFRMYYGRLWVSEFINTQNGRHW